jgi:hypothetical protein
VKTPSCATLSPKGERAEFSHRLLRGDLKDDVEVMRMPPPKIANRLIVLSCACRDREYISCVKMQLQLRGSGDREIGRAEVRPNETPHVI